MKEIDLLIEIMSKLRSNNGCPWDKVQTHQSLKGYLLEETYEVIDTIDRSNYDELKEELGDLLFQIIFHSQLASEKGFFDFKDVCSIIAKKMISRHPHVFSDKKFDSLEEVSKQWQERKKEEGKNKESIFDGIPSELPSLLKAQRIQSRASKVGFDWDDVKDAMPKIYEEIDELRDNINRGNSEGIEEELGDILFSIVNVARLLKINSEDALRKTVNKFILRFHHIETFAKDTGRSINDLTLKEMDELWEATKKL
ncbi:MAG TPA: nucleoside triphosphate pyrophosphohydrolase [Nitrospirae bacterium]|nr:nucleoside triphosphate pyrophosphohydrolase [Nitrospirota bacterium]